LSGRIIGLAIEVHQHSGPGLLGSFYAALCRALERWHSGTGRSWDSSDIQGEFLPLGFRADILVDETIILEIKAVPALLPVHGMQLQIYLRMSGLPAACYSTSTRPV
jgi:GxxExxY protein